MENDEEYMRRAIELAKKGEGWTAPNPMVGAVVVKGGRIIGEGYHERWGEPHGERNALAACLETPEGATMYVTLEPCCHYGKTPPCTEAILRAGIGRVVIGSKDPNPKVAGKGIQVLREAGILVEEGVLQAECDELNSVFFHYITSGYPYVAMKYAMTADGKIATTTGESKWVTGACAREHVQRLRHRYSGIMVGRGTVIRDDPLLTCRLPDGRNPVRIICDSHLQIPLDSQICRTAGEVSTIVAAMTDIGGAPEAEERKAERKRTLEAMGVKVLEIPATAGSGGSSRTGEMDVRSLMKQLGTMGVDSILLEGGGTLNYSILKAGFVNKVYAYIAPKLFGGADAKTPVSGAGVSLPSEAFQLSGPRVSFFGEDVLMEYEVKKCLQEL